MALKLEHSPTAGHWLSMIVPAAETGPIYSAGYVAIGDPAVEFDKLQVQCFFPLRLVGCWEFPDRKSAERIRAEIYEQFPRSWKIERIITRSVGIRIQRWCRARCQWCGTERPFNQLMERDGMLRCHWFCGSRTRPDMDDLPRSRVAWRNGPGWEFGNLLLRNYEHKTDAVRCELCGRPVSWNAVDVIVRGWLVVCGGGCVPRTPRPREVTA